MKQLIAVGLLLAGGVAVVVIAMTVADWKIGAIGVVMFGLGVLLSSDDW